MRKLITLLALVAIFAVATPALATNNADQCQNAGGTWNPDFPGNSQSNGVCIPGPGGGDGGDGGQGGNGGNGGQGGNGGEGGQGHGGASDQAQGQLQGQGQAQGQIGINEQGQSQTGTVTGEQGQDQGQFGYVDTDLTVVDQSDHSIDNDFPVNTAAPVFAGNCAQGVSGQGAGFGGSIASGNPVCDFISVAGAYIAGGDRDNAFRLLGKAEKAADWRFFFSRVRMTLTLGLL